MLSHLKLTNFRNYSDFKLALGQTTLVVGRNGSGKSNLVEAIRLLSVLKSWRARRDDEMVRFGESVARVEGKIKRGNKICRLAVAIDSDRKIAKLDSKVVRVSQAVGTLPSVLFSPEDMILFSGPPTLRRRFIDSLISQTNCAYLKALLKLQAILRQRNRLLDLINRGQAKLDELAVWDEELIATSQPIHSRRQELFAGLERDLGGLIARLGLKGAIKVCPKLILPTTETIAQAHPRDLRYQTTSIGPHLDDFAVELRGKDVSRFGSRGQQRVVIVGLKLAELAYLRARQSVQPTLLLDDVFSELDLRRREALTEILSDQQTILTAVAAQTLPKGIKGQIVQL